MPIVDYNRIYNVRSRERRPVLNPVNVPDAAGAFLRRAVPAAGAAMPGLRARLDDANARHREKVGRDRDRFRAIGDLIGVGKDVALAYAGAVERRDEADLNALQAAWQDHMNAGEDDAWTRPYRRGGADDSRGDGPLVAIQQLNADFDKSDAMRGARPAVKERFAKWRKQALRPYVQRGARKQADAASLFQQNALIAKWQAADKAIGKLYDPDKDTDKAWNDKVAEAIDGKIADTRFQMTRKGLDLTHEQEAGIREELRGKYSMDRFRYWCALVASSDRPDGGEDALAMAQDFAEGLTNDAEKLDARNRIAAATETRAGNVERKEKVVQKEFEESADKALASGDVDKVYGWAENAKRTAATITNSTIRNKILARADQTLGLVEFGRWSDSLDEARRAFDDGDPETGEMLWRQAEQGIATMQSQSGRELATRRMSATFDATAKQVGQVVCDALEHGFYFDDEAGRWQTMDREKALDLFQRHAVFMGREERLRGQKAFDGNRPRLSEQDLDDFTEWLGANNAKALFDWGAMAVADDGKMRLAPKADWGKRGTIDINDGYWKRDVEVDRSVAAGIWNVAQTYASLKKAGVVPKKPDGTMPTLAEYLDSALKDNNNFKRWRDDSVAKRVEETLRTLIDIEDSIFWDNPNPQ